MARTKLTRAAIEQAANLKGQGLSNRDICKALDISEETFYAWQRPEGQTPLQAEFSEHLARAEVSFKASLLQEIERQGRERDWRALSWLLERIFPHDFGKVDRLQAEVKQEKDSSVRYEIFFDYGPDETTE